MRVPWVISPRRPRCAESTNGCESGPGQGCRPGGSTVGGGSYAPPAGVSVLVGVVMPPMADFAQHGRQSGGAVEIYARRCHPAPVFDSGRAQWSVRPGSRVCSSRRRSADTGGIELTDGPLTGRTGREG